MLLTTTGKLHHDKEVMHGRRIERVNMQVSYPMYVVYSTYIYGTRDRAMVS